MPNETMTARERWLAVLNRETPDRVPLDYWGTPEATEKLCTHVGCGFEEACERLHIDTPLSVGGRYAGPPLEDGADVFGIKKRPVDYGTGVYDETINAPLAEYTSVNEIDANYAWPNPDWWTYDHLPEEVKGQEHRIVRGGGSEPMLTYKQLRGEAQAFMDLLANPEIVSYCLEKLFELAYQSTLRIFEMIPGVVSITYVAEDLGGQENLMYSPGQIHEFLFPGMKRMMDLTREHGSFVFTHTDGAVRDIIPDLITLGAQVLNPIQWVCPGMDREGLKRDFGDALIFHGGMDNQRILPFGTVEEVRQEVVDNYNTLGQGGGYILCPCHNIQAVTPPENIVAMYETGYEEGWR
jgi:uroporphyrinogen decarboxylase